MSPCIQKQTTTAQPEIFCRRNFRWVTFISFDKKTQGRKGDFMAFLFSLAREEKYPVKNPQKAYQEDDDKIFGFGKDDLKIKKTCQGSTSYFCEDFQTSPYVEFSTF